MKSLLAVMMQNSQEILSRTLVHLQLSVTSVLIAVLIGVPLGIMLVRIKSISRPVLYILGVFQTIPSLAMLGFLIPVVGIGAKPAIITLVIYSLLVIVQNTVSGMEQVDASVLESAKGIGMNKFQILYKVEIPLALPVILGGVRVSTVTCVGITTLVAAVGAGGLGVLIFRGISIIDYHIILSGALPAALLAIILDTILLIVSKIIKVDT